MIKHYTYLYIYKNFDKQLWHIPKIPNRSSHFKFNETHTEKYVGLADGLYVGHCMLMLMFSQSPAWHVLPPPSRKGRLWPPHPLAIHDQKHKKKMSFKTAHLQETMKFIEALKET